MKHIHLRITSKMEEDRVPLRCGNMKITPAEEDTILDSVENALPEESENTAEELFTEAVMEVSPDGRITLRYEEASCPVWRAPLPS